MLTLSYHCVWAMSAIAQDKFTGCGSLFQAWMCVPRAITAPISYEIERWGRMLCRTGYSHALLLSLIFHPGHCTSQTSFGLCY
jgi:hypothetical protein